MARLISLLWVAGSACAVVLTVLLAALIGAPSESKLEVPETTGGEGPAQDMSIEAVRRHVRRLSDVESRVTGYPGCDRAAGMIEDELRGLGVADIEIQEFETVVPMVREAYLEAETPTGPARIDLHPLWPNLARTNKTGPAGISGLLVDIGKGRGPGLAGKRIRGSVVVMDWDSDEEWLSVPEFGGKAVIFKANDRASGAASRRKFLTVPADIPRYYVKKEDLPALERLLALGNPTVTVRCEMAWERAKAKNILALLREGTDDADGSGEDRSPVVFHAYYDSISVVPGLSPGAEQATGAAALLELGRFLAALPRKPPRPVYLLFTGGHGQALSGITRFMRTLTERLAAAEEPEDGDSLLGHIGRPGLFVGLDLSSHSERLGLFCLGHFRGQYEGQLKHKFSVLGLKLDKYVKSFAKGSASGGPGHFVDCINLTQGRGWWTYFPYRAPFESEVAAMAGFPAVTLGSIDDDRHRVDTPDDRFEKVAFDLLARQIISERGERAGLVNVALGLAFWKGPFTSSGLNCRMARLAGRAVWLDQERDFIPNEPLAGAAVFLKTGRRDKELVGTRALPVALADADGHFDFDGLIQTPSNREFRNCLLEAYGTATPEFIRANERACMELLATRSGSAGDLSEIETDGSIIFAVDMARAGEYPWKAAITGEEQSRNLVCFPCRATTLFGLTDPRGYLALKDVQILNAATQSPPFQFGKSAADTSFGSAEENCCTVWADPSIRVRITLGLGFQEKRLVLINNSPENPVGDGFALDELHSIPSMVLQGAEDMRRLDESRFAKLEFHGVNNPRVRAIREESGRYIDSARNSLASRDYKTYRSASEKGWALESKAYSELLSMTNNMIQGVLFYLALLLPFSYCLERLLFASGTIRKRITWMVAIFAASFTVLALIHPAFRFTLTPFIVLLAFIILALAAWVGVLIVGRFDAMLRERKQSVSGSHEDAGNAASIAVRAVDLGIANIRRRPRRGLLTGLTIVLLTFTLLSFTSIIPTIGISRLRHRSGNPAYKGLLVRDRRWAALPPPLYHSIKRTFESPTRQSRDGEGAPEPDDGGTAEGQDPSKVRPALTGVAEGQDPPKVRPALTGVVAGRAWLFSDVTGRLSQIDLAVARAEGQAPSKVRPALTGVAEGQAPSKVRPAPTGVAEGQVPSKVRPALTGVGDAEPPGGTGSPGAHRSPRSGHFTAVSLLCMEHTEPAITGIDRMLVAGRWFERPDDLGIILPEHVAKSLGCGPEDLGTRILVFGRGIPLIGIIRERDLDSLEDLDGEPLTPVDFVRQEQMASERISAEEEALTLEKYEHHPADQIAIIPLRMGRRLGATLRSVAVRTAPGADPGSLAEGHARRSNQTILASDGERVTLFAALDTSDLSVTGKVGVPVLLGFIMVLGTMLGSVYERRREIFVYNSVGLSPGNVASLFLAESSVYAILGACMGYLFGQIVSKALLETGALSGLSLNYSAGTAVFVAALSMFIVLASTVYPARQAFYAAIPEARREAPRGPEAARTDTVSIFLPFVAGGESILGMQAYMHEFLDGHQGLAVGQLGVEGLAAGVETGEEGKAVPVLVFRAWLAPFDLGISHDVRLRVAYRSDRGVYQYHLTAVRASGDQQNWRRLTPRFIQTLRKQLLMWRILSAEAHQAYTETGKALFGMAGRVAESPAPDDAGEVPGREPLA